MLSVFVDIQDDLEMILEECRLLGRKIDLFTLEEDPEIKDSHMSAIAVRIHSIYTGIEKVLKQLIEYFDGELPSGGEWHTLMIGRGRREISGLRPPIISPEVFELLSELRKFRHLFRGAYHTNLIPRKVIERAEDAVKLVPAFMKDLDRFQRTVEM
jgi:hypothetical protein